MIDPTFVIFGFAAWFAHDIADHIAQTDKVAEEKKAPGLHGWLYAIRHAAEHLVLTVVFLLIAAQATGMPLHLVPLLISVGFIAGTHAIIDRRWFTKWVLEHTGSPGFAETTSPVCGMYLADQSLHKLPIYLGSAIYAIMTVY